MTNEGDARYERCARRMQDALARMLLSKGLTDISVSELAREASVSRATFYAHYDNIHQVYEQLVGRALERVQTFDEHFSCPHSDGSDAHLPFCEKIRTEGELAGVLKDPRFFGEMMARLDADGASSLEGCMREQGVPRSVARALMLFQMSGCHAVATSPLAEHTDWQRIRAALDRFIEGGLAAVREGI